jgi:AcrR family transcriptional regulator
VAFALAGEDPGRPHVDGRVARSQRTISHIVHALLELLERDRALRPTANQVARRAGVSRRALYLHFDSLEDLFATAAERRAGEICAAWDPPTHDMPVAERIDWFVRRWSALCEGLLALQEAAALYEPVSEQVRATFDRGRCWARCAAEHAFQPELAASSGEDRITLTRALHHVTSWTGWSDLRRQGADVEQASRAMRRLLHALLGR